MALTKEDLQQMFNDQNTALGGKLDSAVSALSTATAALTQRTAQIETVVSSQVLLARNKVVGDAENAFAAATHASFEESALMLSPPGPGRKQDGSRDTPSASKDLISDAAYARVSDYVNSTFPGKYYVELTKNGYRLKHSSRSSQVRRADAAKMIQEYRKIFIEQFGLYMHFDRTFEFRAVVKNALSFLRVLKAECSAVEKYAVTNGICVINEVPVAPAALIPRNNASWDGLVQLFAGVVPGLRQFSVARGSKGVLYDKVGDYYALAAGVRFLPPVEVATAV
jgi:hypothetical protein